jgi:hypothetical protein
MNDLLQTVSTGWHPARFIYLIIGAMLMVQAVQSKDLPFALLGGLFLYQSLFNTGCCGMSGAFRAHDKAEASKSLEDTDYTEIK